MRISGTDIYIAKGDSAYLTLTIENAEGSEVEMIFSDGLNPISETVSDGKVELFIDTGEDGLDLKIKTYYYDIVLTNEEITTTLIRRALFVVEPTAKDIATSDPISQGSNL